MSVWAKQAGERIRDANDHSSKRRDWWMFVRNEIMARGERLWLAIVKECQREAECFNAELPSPDHHNAIQPFAAAIPFTVIIRQLTFPETRVECTMNREARELAITWFRKVSHASAETQESEIFDLDVSEETGDICVKRSGIPLTTNQLAELILTPLMNKRQRQPMSRIAS